MFYILKIFGMNIKPLSDRVVLQWLGQETQTQSGIFIPESSKKERPFVYEVVAVWPGTKEKKMTVKVWQKVLCGQYAWDEVKHDNKDYKIVGIDYILAVVED
jgi:chaperonin GroES